MGSEPQSREASRVRARRQGCQVTRKVERLTDGLLRLDQRVRVSGCERGLDATGRFWMLAVVEVRHGAVEYISDRDRLTPPGRVFGVSAPPFSILEVVLNRSQSSSRGFVSTAQISPALPSEPVAFDVAFSEVPASISELVRKFAERSTTIRIGRCRRPLPLALRTKTAIDKTYSLPIPLSALAVELRTSASAMSRAFKRSYGMPPVRYRHVIRTMDGMMRLLDGEPVTRVFQDVGFDDLTRFYQHFKRYTLSTPSKYRF